MDQNWSKKTFAHHYPISHQQYKLLQIWTDQINISKLIYALCRICDLNLKLIRKWETDMTVKLNRYIIINSNTRQIYTHTHKSKKHKKKNSNKSQIWSKLTKLQKRKKKKHSHIWSCSPESDSHRPTLQFSKSHQNFHQVIFTKIK